MVTVETIERQEVGPYEGQRIAGTSEDVVNVVVTVEYRYQTFTIRVEGSPARDDRATGRQYIAAQVGAPIMRRVNAIADAIEQSRARDLAELSVRDVPVTVGVRADEYLAAA